MTGERYGSIFITEDPNEMNPELADKGWIWIKASTGQVYKWNGSDWEDSGLVVGSPAGVTGQKIIGSYKFTFYRGLLADFEEV